MVAHFSQKKYMKNLNNIYTNITPTWCPGCGNYLILANLLRSFKEKKLKRENIVIVYDIGCVGNMADFVNTYAIHSLHGRCIPTAVGVKLANPKLSVFAIGGDGGVYGEGLNHLIASTRSNYPIKVIVSNNFLYSLTTGQASPTTPKGSLTKSTPFGVPGIPIDPLKLIPTVNPHAFVKSVEAKEPSNLSAGFDKLFSHSGFGLLDIKFDCVSFGKSK